jgi:hypothetical protein
MAIKLLSLVLPGLWHVMNDRCGGGLGIFAVFAAGLNGFLVWPLAVGPGGAGWRYALLAVSVAAWLFSVAAAFGKRAPPPPSRAP